MDDKPWSERVWLWIPVEKMKQKENVGVLQHLGANPSKKWHQDVLSTVYARGLQEYNWMDKKILKTGSQKRS